MLFSISFYLSLFLSLGTLNMELYPVHYPHHNPQPEFVPVPYFLTEPVYTPIMTHIPSPLLCTPKIPLL